MRTRAALRNSAAEHFEPAIADWQRYNFPARDRASIVSVVKIVVESSGNFQFGNLEFGNFRGIGDDWRGISRTDFSFKMYIYIFFLLYNVLAEFCYVSLKD